MSEVVERTNAFHGGGRIEMCINLFFFAGVYLRVLVGVVLREHWLTYPSSIPSEA